MYDCILAVGLSSGVIEIFDVERNCSVRAFKTHSNRVSAFTFVDNMLVSGSKDKSILVHDLRLSSPVIKAFNGHSGEVCSLKAKNAS
jgi:WD40 repeat protein